MCENIIGLTLKKKVTVCKSDYLKFVLVDFCSNGETANGFCLRKTVSVTLDQG